MNLAIEQAMPHIKAALEYAGGTHLPGDVANAILAGQLQLWPGEKSAIVTELEQYPQMRTCHLFLAGGDMGELKRMLPAVEAWAKSKGCAAVTLTGRKGWARSFMADVGYESHLILMSKEIR